MSRIVLATFGSLGSVHPYLAVALGLKACGHDPVIATGETHRRNVEREGLRFHPVRPDRSVVTSDQDANTQAGGTRNRSEFSVKNLLRYSEQTYTDLLDACHGADLFISNPGAFVAPLVMEKLALPWFSVALAPGTLFSALDPPVLPFLPWLAKIPRVGAFPHSLIFHAFKKLTRKWMLPLDELRRKVGLPPSSKHPFFDGMFSPYGTLAWFSSVLATPQQDWPPHARVTGFPFYDREEGLGIDPALDAFLDRGDPPVVFTLGSNVVREAGPFYSHSFEAARRLGCRAVLLTGSDPRNRPSGKILENIFVADYAPYSQIFPRASVVVHQGGVGTTGQAMAAGVPMLIVPHIHDQPDNAYRTQKLGVARVIAPGKYSADRAVPVLSELLTAPTYRQRAHRIRDEMKKEDGVRGACDAIESMLGAESTRGVLHHG